MIVIAHHYIFFFSSRRRHTRFDCDWSSDVCSSDLAAKQRQKVGAAPAVGMKERNGVQFYGFIVGVQSQSSVEGVQVDVSVRQHHPLGLGAGTAGVKELGKRVFIDLHDVSAIRGSAGKERLEVRRGGPTGLRDAV